MLERPPSRILIIKPSALGDVVHSLPILNLLRRKWPEARISWLVTPAFAGLLEGHPQVDEVIRFDRKLFGTGWWNPLAFFGFISFLRDLRRRQFDLVIDLQGLFRSGWIAGATGARVRVGFADAREMGWIFYTHRVAVETWEQHALGRYLEIAEALGCGREPVEFVFPPALPLSEPIAERYAVLLPATNWATKRWPIESFAQLVAPLRDRFGLRTVVAGAADTRGMAAEIGRLAEDDSVIDLAGKTSLRQLITLLRDAAVVVANDSGPMHIASALNVPLVTLFGPTSPIRTGPYERMDTVVRLDIACSPCYSRRCSHRSCLRWLESGKVMAEVGRQMERKSGVIGRG
jgi:lipopolysaccharide heptosyltransferase I